MRPCDYWQGGTENFSTPLQIRDIQFFVFNQTNTDTNDTPQTFTAATIVSILFTNQKNGVKYESISHSATGHPRECAGSDIRSYVAYIWQHGTTGCIPLAVFLQNNKWTLLHRNDITNTPHTALQVTIPQVGFTHKEVSTHSMPVGRDMELLIARVYNVKIILVERWQSDTMLF